MSKPIDIAIAPLSFMLHFDWVGYLDAYDSPVILSIIELISSVKRITEVPIINMVIAKIIDRMREDHLAILSLSFRH